MNIAIAIARLLDSDLKDEGDGTVGPDYALHYLNEQCLPKLVKVLKADPGNKVHVIVSEHISHLDIAKVLHDMDMLILFGHGGRESAPPVVYNRRKEPKLVLFEPSMLQHSMGLIVINACHSARLWDNAPANNADCFIGFHKQAFTPKLALLEVNISNSSTRNRIIEAFDHAYVSPSVLVVERKNAKEVVDCCRAELEKCAEGLAAECHETESAHLGSCVVAIKRMARRLTYRPMIQTLEAWSEC